jgi:hypothetical protein
MMWVTCGLPNQPMSASRSTLTVSLALTRAHLAGGRGDLRDAASTERLFDRDLLTLSLPQRSK